MTNAPTTHEPRSFLNAKALQNFAIRYAMVLVLLVVIAFFTYRSARFGTVDNLTTILIEIGRAHV